MQANNRPGGPSTSKSRWIPRVVLVATVRTIKSHEIQVESVRKRLSETLGDVLRGHVKDDFHDVFLIESRILDGSFSPFVLGLARFLSRMTRPLLVLLFRLCVSIACALSRSGRRMSHATGTTGSKPEAIAF